MEGLRSIERQKQLFKDGFTKTLNSKHLEQPDGYGYAIDLYPYPIDMVKVNKASPVEIVRFGLIAGAMFAAAKELGVDITWGADWDNDGQTLDHTFFDAPHFELTTKGK
jgi:peptidoglycan L-alanyl-D-glutamate endopeptidase CwlK